MEEAALRAIEDGRGKAQSWIRERRPDSTYREPRSTISLYIAFPGDIYNDTHYLFAAFRNIL
jgi:hypothetical protein